MSKTGSHFIITHRIGLEDAPTMYRTFRDKQDSYIKVVMKPGGITRTWEWGFAHERPDAASRASSNAEDCD